MGDFTREQLWRRAVRFQRLTDRHYANKKVYGEQRFIETEAGRVRVLGYGLGGGRTLPLFVNIHGGGFVIGHPEMDDPFMPRVAAEAGVKIISIDYGLAPQNPFPAPLHQCYAAIKYAQENSGEFGIDRNRIAVGGHSAGGCLTAAVCILNAERRQLGLRAAILDYPGLDLYTDAADKPRGHGLVARTFLSNRNATFFNASYCFDRDGRRDPLVSPVYASREQLRGFPPTLVITAGKDSLCAEALRFRDMLEDAGVRTSHGHFEKSEHGFTLTDKPASREGWGLMIRHLRDCL